jgi:hypothetical protein
MRQFTEKESGRLARVAQLRMARQDHQHRLLSLSTGITCPDHTYQSEEEDRSSVHPIIVLSGPSPRNAN